MLTQAKLKTIKPLAKIARHHDQHGLYLQVMPNGSKYWRLKYHIRNGDHASANLLLARAIPPLKPVGAGLEITGDPKSFGELATSIILALAKGGDAQAAKDALQALSAASRIYELSDLEDRVRTLEEQEKQEDEKRRKRKERKAGGEAQSCPS